MTRPQLAQRAFLVGLAGQRARAGERAGIAPDECSRAGFASDGERGCEPVLPRAACRPGQLALPGDRACHAIAPCGSGTWGDIPASATTQHVDLTYLGGDSDGTTAKPWPTIGAAIAAAQVGATIAVAAGSYGESVVIDKAVVVRGRCPIWWRCPAPGPATVQMLAGGATVRGVAITGTVGVGVATADASLEELWIHDTADVAVFVEGSATLRGVLTEELASRSSSS